MGVEQMIVFDLDGTLALDEHRAHHLRKDPKDWVAYFAACEGDSLNEPLAQLIRDLNDYYTIGLWSGRSKSVELLTFRWLVKHKLRYQFNQFRFRDADDRTQDTDLKRRWLHEQNATGDPVTLVFEDRKRVVDMWRSEGIVCCQVAPGEF